VAEGTNERNQHAACRRDVERQLPSRAHSTVHRHLYPRPPLAHDLRAHPFRPALPAALLFRLPRQCWCVPPRVAPAIRPCAQPSMALVVEGSAPAREGARVVVIGGVSFSRRRTVDAIQRESARERGRGREREALRGRGREREALKPVIYAITHTSHIYVVYAITHTLHTYVRGIGNNTYITY